jgi:hypothetical protein
MAGQIAGMVREQQTAAEIIAEVAQEVQALIAGSVLAQRFAPAEVDECAQ